MANDDKSGTNLASGGVIFVALVATGIFFPHHDAPLLGSRPVATDARVQKQGADHQQRIDARLWQDPFAVIAKRDLEQQCLKNPSDDACKSPLAKEDEKEDKETLVLGVTVSGAPFTEDAEQRRRTRYAVLAGLERAGFVPSDAHHLRYFFWPQGDEATIRNQGFSAIDPQQAIVPFERFERGSQPTHGENQNILVLWLNEEVLNGGPLHKLTELVKFLGANTRIKFIGPYSSDILHDMVTEARKSGDVSCKGEVTKDFKWPELSKVQFYAYGASAPDSHLLGNLTETCSSVQRYFEYLGIFLQRTVATDDTLARGIAMELKRHHVRLGPVGKLVHLDDSGDLALIAEWDTFYGQTLPQAVERQIVSHHTRPGRHLQSRDGLDYPWIHKYSYLRGLDGQLPQAAEDAQDQKKDKTTAEGEKQSAATALFKTEPDTKNLERPMGQGQFDYLRRISEQLRKVDDDLRKKKGSKIKAVGILGSDVFDKLLILRALRPQFPEALFFTTDFDEAFTMESELLWTRNLIVSSSFGPNLNIKFQGEIPPFRGSYQTSAFLATLSAIDNPKSPGIFRDVLSDQLLVPRIFEIERHGNLLSYAEGSAPLIVFPPDNHDRKHDANPLTAGGGTVEGRSSTSGRTQVGTRDRTCWIGEDLSNCGDIQPPVEQLYPTFEERSRTWVASGLAGSAIFVLGMFCIRAIRESAAIEIGLLSLALVAAALTCAFWDDIARFLTEGGNGEPIAMLQGISIWPTVLLRVLGIILALYFIYRAQRSLGMNFADIASDMKLDQRSAGHQDMCLRKITGLFDFSFKKRQQAPPTPPSEGDVAWNAYVDQERFWRRCTRAFMYTGLMFLIYEVVLVPLIGEPNITARSNLALTTHSYMSYANALLMVFLTMFVFDATFLCLLFVYKLRRARAEWPPSAMRLFEDHLGLQAKFVHDWVDLEFIAKRTRCIGSLIYYPFALIALLIVSRSVMFANYPPSLPHLIIQGISLSIVFGCAVMLCYGAKAARDTTKENLVDWVICAKGQSTQNTTSGSADQLEILLSRVDQLHEGAFRPFSQQPLVRAVLLPLGSFGWTALIENGMLPGL